MQLLSNERPASPIEEELDLKEESEDEMTLQDRAIMQIRKIVGNSSKFQIPQKASTEVESPTVSDKERQQQELEK